MPSSGYGMVELIPTGTDEDRKLHHQRATLVLECAKDAMKHGLFIEWLACFIAAWEKSKDACIAANAGCIEWDF